MLLLVFSLWVSLIREFRSSGLIYSLQLNGRLHNKLLYVCAESRKASRSWSRVIPNNHTCTKSPVLYATAFYDIFVAVQWSCKGTVCRSTARLDLLPFDLRSWPSGGEALPNYSKLQITFSWAQTFGMNGCSCVRQLRCVYLYLYGFSLKQYLPILILA